MILGIIFLVFCSTLGRHLVFGAAQRQDRHRPDRRGFRLQTLSRPLACRSTDGHPAQPLVRFRTRADLAEPFVLRPGLHGGHADRAAARARPAVHHQPVAAADLFDPHRRRAHHAGRHLLRRAIRRQRERHHHEDPACQQHRGLHRRLPDDAQGQDRPGAVHRRHLQLHRRHRGHRGAFDHGARAGRGRLPVRAGRLLRADAAGLSSA
jgi:hypothetical protein